MNRPAVNLLDIMSHTSPLRPLAGAGAAAGRPAPASAAAAICRRDRGQRAGAGRRAAALTLSAAPLRVARNTGIINV